MRHHLRRAGQVYKSQGFKKLAKTSLTYFPIEINNLIYRLRHGSGVQVMNEDWDTLILLDGCRYDMFNDQVNLEGSLDSRISLGSTSEEFFERNFEDEIFHKTVYINTNAYLPKIGMYEKNIFHTIIDLLDEWDDDIGVVPPETVVEAAHRAHEEYPNKRIIVHFMQPHYPFIGKYGQTIQQKIDDRSVWRALRNGETSLDRDEVWRGYRENLDVVLSHVSDLCEELTGKVVISADHGNMVGERQGPVPTHKMYGHYWGIYSDELVKVPWYTCEFDERRAICSDPPESVESQSDDVIQDRLEALGYVG